MVKIHTSPAQTKKIYSLAEKVSSRDSIRRMGEINYLIDIIILFNEINRLIGLVSGVEFPASH